MKYRIITSQDPTSFVSEEYHKLKLNLDYSSIDKKNQVIQVTSTVMSEGKTITVLNLAVSYSQNGKKVVLIDLDLRRPKVHRGFNFKNENGISEYLADKIDKSQLIKKTEIGVDVILAGEKTPFINSLLESKKLKDLIEELRKEYDYVLIDTPPVSVVADPLIISKIVDGVVYVVASRKAKKTLIKESLNSLKLTGCNVLGVCFTQVKKADFGDYKTKYHRYE